MPFYIINAHTEAKSLVRRWLHQYEHRYAAVAQSLESLPDDPTPDEVDEAFARCAPAIGHTNRVDREFSCDECCQSFPSVVRLDCSVSDSYTHLCFSCVLKLVKLVQ